MLLSKVGNKTNSEWKKNYWEMSLGKFIAHISHIKMEMDFSFWFIGAWFRETFSLISSSDINRLDSRDFRYILRV